MKILIVNTKFLGDLIVSTPGFRSLRKKYPDAELVLLVRKGYEDAVRNNPNINRIISFDFGVKKKNIFSRIAQEIMFVRQIRNEKYDAVISLHPGDRIAFLAWFSKAKIRIAPRKQPFNFLFNILVDVEEDTISYLSYYNKLISAFTKEEVKGKTEFPLTAADEKWSKEFLIGKGISENDFIIGIHPGASEPTKIWPAENFSGLIRNCLSLNKLKVLLIAGPKEDKIVKKISQLVNDENTILFESKDINRTAALMQKCELFISNDTATRHLAVALSVPVIALMPDDNQVCWNFYDEKDEHFVITGKRQFPLNKNPYLGEITVEKVFNKVKEILEQ